jgi:hypothetical protein
VGRAAGAACSWPLIYLTNWPVEHIYLHAQLGVFLLGAVLMQWEALRFAIVPNSIKRARAHQKAVEQFLAQNLHTTKGRTGVLIYRVLRRALRRGDRRRRHLQEGAARDLEWCGEHPHHASRARAAR